jgi:hypothetical protein
VRSSFHLLVDPERGSADPQTNRHRLLCHEKQNLTGGYPTRTFLLERTLLPADHSQPEVTTARVIPNGTSHLSWREAKALLRGTEQHSTPGVTKTARTRQWLADYLNAHGTVRRIDLIAAAEAEGYAESTLKRVADDLGVVFEQPDGVTGKHTWRLPDPEPPVSPTSTNEPEEPTELTELTAPARGNDLLSLEQSVSSVSPVSPSSLRVEKERADDPPPQGTPDNESVLGPTPTVEKQPVRNVTGIPHYDDVEEWLGQYDDYDDPNIP